MCLILVLIEAVSQLVKWPLFMFFIRTPIGAWVSNIQFSRTCFSCETSSFFIQSMITPPSYDTRSLRHHLPLIFRLAFLHQPLQLQLIFW